MNCPKCNVINNSNEKFCSSCGAEINNPAITAQISSVKNSRWPFVIAVVSSIISVVYVGLGEYASILPDSLATLAGFGLFVSAIWYFVRRIKSKGWRRIDKIVLVIIGALFLMAVISLALV